MRKMTWSGLHFRDITSCLSLISSKSELETRQFTVFGKWPQGAVVREWEKWNRKELLPMWATSAQSLGTLSGITQNVLQNCPSKGYEAGHIPTDWDSPIGWSLPSGPLHPLSGASCTEIRSELWTIKASATFWQPLGRWIREGERLEVELEDDCNIRTIQDEGCRNWQKEGSFWRHRINRTWRSIGHVGFIVGRIMSLQSMS